jgi:hypothetical protein
MAEIDPGEAVRLAVTLALDEPQLVPVFRSLARDDAAAAWRAVGRIDEPALARSIALSLLAVLGYDAPNIERALAAIPTVGASRFEVDALGLFAADDPEAALAAAIAIPARDTRSLAIDAVVRVWAKTDPVAALARVDDLADSELRQPARYGILQQWAAQDPIAALEHFGAQEGFAFGPAGPALVPIMQQLAAADPHELLAAAARLPGQARMMAKQVALQRLALVDPGAAIAYVEREASGIERQRLLASIANGYGRTDPEAALAWARSVQPPVQGLMAAVLTGMAQKDPERALALALAEDPFGRAPTVQMVVTTAVASGATEVATLADRLLSLPDSPARQRALGSLATTWAQTDSERFVSWLVANGARLPIEALRGAANVLPQQNPDIAAAYVDQVPGALRADWIAATASGYSRVDPERALVWLDRFRGEPVYEPGVAALAQQLASSDPRRAAALLESVGTNTDVARRALPVIAMQWAQQDPVAAVQWASTLPERGGRSETLNMVMQQWARLDAQGARNWAMGLPSGSRRDQALVPVVSAIAATATPDASLLDAFSDDAMRYTALRNALFPLAQRDPDEARALVARHFTDPAQRREAEQLIEQASKARVGVGIATAPPFGVVTPVAIDEVGLSLRSR